MHQVATSNVPSPTPVSMLFGSPATKNEAVAVLTMISASFPEAEVDENTRALRLQGYLLALDGFTNAVLKAAAQRVIKGEVSGFDTRFMPTPPQIRRLCDETRAAMYRAEQERQRVRDDPEPDRYAEPPNPSVVKRFDALQSTLAKSAAMGRPEPKAKWPLSEKYRSDQERARIEIELAAAERNPRPVEVSAAVAGSRLARSDWEPRF